MVTDNPLAIYLAGVYKRYLNKETGCTRKRRRRGEMERHGDNAWILESSHEEDQGGRTTTATPP